MTKTNFIKLLKEDIKLLSIDKQISLLDKIEKEWIPELKKNILKNYTWCYKCKKYHPTSKYKKETNRETRIITTYTDAGYGDDDRYGEVEYNITYSICPNCGYKNELNKSYLRTLWEKGRY